MAWVVAGKHGATYLLICAPRILSGTNLEGAPNDGTVRVISVTQSGELSGPPSRPDRRLRAKPTSPVRAAGRGFCRILTRRRSGAAIVARRSGQSPQRRLVPVNPLRVAGRLWQSLVVRQVLPQICDLHAPSDLVLRDSPDVVLVRLADPTCQAVDGGYDIGLVTGLDQVSKIKVGVLDCVVENSGHLVDRLSKREHDSQRVKDVRLRFGRGVAVTPVRQGGQSDRVLDGGESRIHAARLWRREVPGGTIVGGEMPNPSLRAQALGALMARAIRVIERSPVGYPTVVLGVGRPFGVCLAGMVKVTGGVVTIVGGTAGLGTDDGSLMTPSNVS